MDDEVGFVGLGVMGSAMAANVVAARPLVVWNRTPAAAHRMGQAGARVAATSTEVFRRCRTVVLMLADESALDPVLRDARPPLADRTVVQMGTVAPDWSRRLADHVRAAGGRYVEAPASGWLFAETEQLGHAGDDMVAVIEAYRRRTAVGGEPLLHPHGTEEPA